MDSWCDAAGPDVVPTEVRSFVWHGSARKPNLHGNNVARLIACTDPARVGVAPGCALYVAEVVGNLKLGWQSMCDALRWALDLGADVVNMSFACPESYPDCDALLEMLDSSGCICVAAYNPLLHWPHVLPAVVSAGIDSQEGSVDLCAAGEPPAAASGPGRAFCGTSAAAARIAGIAACAKAYRHSITRLEFLETLGKKNPA